MLPVYGEKMPLRLLEQIVFWKTKEAAQAFALRRLVPGLEAPFDQLLQEWEEAFQRTRDLAQAAIRAALETPEPDRQLPEAWTNRLPEIAEEAICESREFIRQLALLQEQSLPVRSSPYVAAVVDHLRREPEAFLGEMEELTELRTFSWLRDPNGEGGEDDSQENFGGPQPADGPQSAGAPLRPEGTWSAPLDTGARSNMVPIGGHQLPPLPYAYNALEPWIDEKTMRIHHDKHHKSYVDGLNHAEKKLEEARKTSHFDLVKHWERELAFNGAGHYLHTIFWDTMSPRGGGQPSGPLADEINRSFGSFAAFKKQFAEAANKVEGGGWAILVWSPRSHRLELLTAEKHQNLSQWDVVPLLPLDVWEHAYYLKHQNDRAAYIKDWWNVVNWAVVADRYTQAQTLRWVPY